MRRLKQVLRCQNIIAAQGFPRLARLVSAVLVSLAWMSVIGNFCSPAWAQKPAAEAVFSCAGWPKPLSMTQLGQLIEQKNSDAMLCLGDAYDHGKGVAQDVQLAAQWVRQAAENGNVDAMLRYGEMLAAGRGVLPDAARAAIWYRRAATRDNPQAQILLGEMYEEGKGVTRNLKEAAAWYGRAALRKEPLAMARLGRMFVEGRGLKKDDQQATLLLFNAAMAGEPSAVPDLASLAEADSLERSTLFGLRPDSADRAGFRAAMRSHHIPVVREKDEFFCDVYETNKVLPGSSLMAACFEADGQQRLALLKINYSAEAKVDAEKLMATFEERLGPPSARDGDITRIWNFGPVVAIGQFVPTDAETSLMYLVPSVYAPLLRTVPALSGLMPAERP